MPKALVVYATRTQKTKEIANHIAEGIKAAGSEVTVLDVKSIRCPSELEGYDGYAFGSATYHGEMMEAMKTILFMAEKANLDGKIGGAFGSYGWSGEAPDRIYQTMQNIFNMKMVNTALRIKSPAPLGDAQLAQAYGREIGQKIKA
jgi:flavorubredoxin